MLQGHGRKYWGTFPNSFRLGAFRKALKSLFMDVLLYLAAREGHQCWVWWFTWAWLLSAVWQQSPIPLPAVLFRECRICKTNWEKMESKICQALNHALIGWFIIHFYPVHHPWAISMLRNGLWWSDAWAGREEASGAGEALQCCEGSTQCLGQAHSTLTLLSAVWSELSSVLCPRTPELHGSLVGVTKHLPGN